MKPDMEELSSLNTDFLKRKKIAVSPADQLDGTLTRSESHMCIYRSGSGSSRPEVVSEEPSPVADFSVLDCGNAWGGSSIKDLRARRVFTPDVNSILQEQNEDNLGEGKDSLKGLDSDFGRGRVLDMGSGNMKVDEAENCDDVMISEVEEVKQSNTDNGIPTKKNEAISEDGSVLRSKMVMIYLFLIDYMLFLTAGYYGWVPHFFIYLRVLYCIPTILRFLDKYENYYFLFDV